MAKRTGCHQCGGFLSIEVLPDIYCLPTYRRTVEAICVMCGRTATYVLRDNVWNRFIPDLVPPVRKGGRPGIRD